MINYFTGKPPRAHENNALYFVTFCTYKRIPYLHEKGVPEMLIENLRFYGKRLREMIAYTIMPDHIHLLVDVEEAQTLSAFLRGFKKFAAKEIKRMLQVTEAHIWQRGSMDHCIRFSWTNDDLRTHVEYIFYNSWKHMRIPPTEFPYHNILEVVARGWIGRDICLFDEKTLKHGNIYE